MTENPNIFDQLKKQIKQLKSSAEILGETGKEIPAAMELVRLAMPRRVYTQSHVDFMVEAILEAYRRREEIGGFRFTYQAPVLRHFTADFEPLYAVGGN